MDLNLDNINLMLQSKDSYLYRSIIIGHIGVDNKFHKGITTLIKEMLQSNGAWEDYLAFESVFKKVNQALIIISKKLGMLYGNQN